MTRKPSPKVFISEELAQCLRKLGSEHKIAKWISDMKTVLKENMFAGELIRKSQIPKQYIDHYGVNNLYRYSHPKGSVLAIQSLMGVLTFWTSCLIQNTIKCLGTKPLKTKGLRLTSSRPQVLSC